ncbi:MAG: ABC transporter substrate-binding protein [Desulfobacter sp.]|nr:MAG: ABC transporter substrate-binding protein [Desulfobacter sp.]
MTTPRPDRHILKPHKRIRALMALVVCLVLGLSGIGQVEQVADQKGRILTFSTPFKRIISLYGAHTENLFYLGAETQLVGVSINDTYPEQVRTKQDFSYHDDLEKFLSVQPDLILIRPMIENGYPKLIHQLRSYGITVISLQPSSVEQMYDYWLALGKLTGKNKAAQALVLKFKENISNIQERTQKISPKKRVYFQSIHTRMKTFTPEAMPIFALETAGGINVATDARASRNTNVAIYGKEQILAKANQIDVFLAQKGIMNPVEKKNIMNEPGFHIIKAIKKNQVFLIDESIVSRPVPRLYQGILAIGNLLYPEIFTGMTKQKGVL